MRYSASMGLGEAQSDTKQNSPHQIYSAIKSKKKLILGPTSTLQI